VLKELGTHFCAHYVPHCLLTYRPPPVPLNLVPGAPLRRITSAKLHLTSAKLHLKSAKLHLRVPNSTSKHSLHRSP